MSFQFQFRVLVQNLHQFPLGKSLNDNAIAYNENLYINIFVQASHLSMFTLNANFKKSVLIKRKTVFSISL